jgi:hypothetical protein
LVLGSSDTRHGLRRQSASGDGAFRAGESYGSFNPSGACESGVALRLPPQSIKARSTTLILFDRRVFGGVLFGQGRLAQRDLGREAGEQHNQISFHVHNPIQSAPQVRHICRTRTQIKTKLRQERHIPDDVAPDGA